jgi:hypothetical protein
VNAFEPITPGSATIELINTTAEINAQSGILNPLDAKLDSAVKALDDVNDNNDASTVYKLQAFINAVEAQRGNHISEDDANIQGKCNEFQKRLLISEPIKTKLEKQHLFDFSDIGDISLKGKAKKVKLYGVERA